MLGIILVLISISLVVADVPNFEVVEVVPSNEHASVTIPEDAVEIAPGIFSLGTTVDIDGAVLEGYAIVDYKKGYHHRPGHNGGGSNEATNSCFSFLSSGAKWKTLENYLVDPNNSVRLDQNFVRTNIAGDIQEWENAVGRNIFGPEVPGIVNRGSIGNSMNGQNEVIFGSIASPGAIAVTYVWGIFSGPPSRRELREWDQIYDQIDFLWNNNGDPNAMDFENIAQHELGHSFGLGHPSDTCTEETMYRFASEGEIKKRDLNAGDISGIRRLYA